MKADQVETLLPCRWCDMATSHSTLAALGARCRRCYETYCTEAQRPQKVPEPPKRRVITEGAE